jgi:hypothetical protein
MSCRFASQPFVERYLTGLDPQQARAYEEHLAGECAECDALYASLGGAAVHQRLIAALDRRTGFTPPDAAQTAAAHATLVASFPRRARAGLFAALAAACVVLLAVVLGPAVLRGRGGDEQRFKGAGLALRVERGELRDGRLVVVGAVAPGGEARSGEQLLLSYVLPGRGRIELGHLDSSGKRELVYRSVALEVAGLHRVARGATSLMFSLAGLEGQQTFEATFTPERGEPQRARAVVVVRR